MNTTEVMIEAMARAMWSLVEDEITFDEAKGLDDAAYRWALADARAALAGVLPMLADDLAGVLSRPQYVATSRTAPPIKCFESYEGAIRAHLASLAAAMKGEG